MNGEIPKDYLAIPLQEGRTVRSINVAVIQKDFGDMLKEQRYTNMHHALVSLFVMRNQEVAPSNEVFVISALEHYIKHTTHIYLALTEENVVIGYALADKAYVHDIFVAKEYRRDRIGISLVNMIMHKNQEAEYVNFLSKREKKEPCESYFFSKLEASHPHCGYNNDHFKHSHQVVNQVARREKARKEITGRLAVLAADYEVVQGKVKLDGLFSVKQLHLLAELAELEEGTR
jgi:hypothetical protein